jgi:hypothetical protein
LPADAELHSETDTDPPGLHEAAASGRTLQNRGRAFRQRTAVEYANSSLGDAQNEETISGVLRSDDYDGPGLDRLDCKAILATRLVDESFGCGGRRKRDYVVIHWRGKGNCSANQLPFVICRNPERSDGCSLIVPIDGKISASDLSCPPTSEDAPLRGLSGVTSSHPRYP